MKYALLVIAGLVAAGVAYIGFERGPKELETPPHVATVAWDSSVVVESASEYGGILNGHVRLNDPSNADGCAFSFDFEYPTDFEAARWLPVIDNESRVEGEAFIAHTTTPMIWSSCLYSFLARSLNIDESLKISFVDMNICRAVSTDDPKKTALVGMLISVELGPDDRRRKIPMALKTERCVAEATVWFEHVGEPKDRFAICVVIDSVDGNRVELIVLERIGDQLVVLSGIAADIGRFFKLRTGQSWDSQTVARYDLIKSWRGNSELMDSAIPDAWEQIRAKFENGDIERFTERNAIKISAIDFVDGVFQYTYTTTSTILVEQWLANLPAGESVEQQLRHGVNVLTCNDALTAALLDMQYLRTLFTYRIIDPDGAELANGPISSRCIYFR